MITKFLSRQFSSTGLLCVEQIIFLVVETFAQERTSVKYDRLLNEFSLIFVAVLVLDPTDDAFSSFPCSRWNFLRQIKSNNANCRNKQISK